MSSVHLHLVTGLPMLCLPVLLYIGILVKCFKRMPQFHKVYRTSDMTMVKVLTCLYNTNRMHLCLYSAFWYAYVTHHERCFYCISCKCWKRILLILFTYHLFSTRMYVFQSKCHQFYLSYCNPCQSALSIGQSSVFQWKEIPSSVIARWPK